MKKIVALVLSLVMVLGLATTAFAAATPAYFTDNMETLAKHSTCDTVANTYSLEAYTTGSATAKTFDQVAIWATNKLTGAKVMVATYVVATSPVSAETAFVDGTSITYLNYTYGQAGKTYTGAATAFATVDAEDAAKCGDVFNPADKAVYTDAKGVKYFEAVGGAAYVVDGKCVLLSAVTTEKNIVVDEIEGVSNANILYTVVHDYDVDLKTVVYDTTVTRVFCAECKAEFAFVEGTVADAVAKFGAGNYIDLGDGLFVAKAAGVAAAPEAGDKVESAETFDAGIAMYVGMSVMAAAGSAVVLKKKD